MNKKLWEPSKTLKLNSNLFKFEKFISNRFKKKFNGNYEKIHNWTIKNPQSFLVLFLPLFPFTLE